jgi:SAM-dependent methyltransferase
VASGVRNALHEVKVTLKYRYYRAFKGGRVLNFQGAKYPYLYRRYNLTVQNERAVELPIAWAAASRCAPDRVLEIGNVLAHYYPIKHQVLDKYEVAPGVINADVVDFQPGKQYDLILAISTLEHVGWDEEPRDPPKFRRAVANLTSLLAPGGTLLITLPVGYNSEVDTVLRERALPFTTLGFLKRATPDNIWREADWNAVANEKYLTRVPTSTAIAVATIVRP